MPVRGHTAEAMAWGSEPRFDSSGMCALVPSTVGPLGFLSSLPSLSRCFKVGLYFLGAGERCLPVTSASPAGKFEDREDRVPKLEQINSTRILSSQNFSLTKKELLSTELLLLEAFSWNLCLPTPAHFLDYYLLASISQKDHHCHSWPTTCPRKTKECLKEYAHYFLEVTLQGGGRCQDLSPLPRPRVVSIQGVLTDWGQSPQISCFAGNKQRQGEDLPNVLPVTCKREVAACVQAAGPLHTDRSLGHLSYGDRQHCRGSK